MKQIIQRGIFFALGFMLFLYFTKVLQNKSPITQKTIEGYYCEQQNSLDFIFIGNSMTYTAINPAVLWEEYGIVSYNFAVSEQIIPISYYYIEEALKTQKPKAIVLNVTSGANQLELRDSMLHVNLDYLPWSMTKIHAIVNIVPRDKWIEFFFPIIRMHGNWQNINRNSIEYMQAQGMNESKGYAFVNPYPDEKTYSVYEYPYDMSENIERYCYDDEFEEGVLLWYQKIIDITKENNVDLILIGIPNGGGPEYQGYFNPIFKYALEQGVTCINYNLKMSGENHNPANNAEIFTRLLGGDLISMYEIETKDKSDSEYEEWNRCVLAYEQEWNAARLSNTCDPKEWFQLADDENYTFFFAMDIDKFTDDYILDMFSVLGTTELIQYDGKISGVVSQDNAAYYHNMSGGLYVECGDEVVRMLIDESSVAEIKFGQNIVRGMNCSIMVYDNILQRIVDKVIISDDYAQLSRENLKI